MTALRLPIELNSQQKRAVQLLNSGPLRVIAGPGTGKSTTVVEMYSSLVEGEGVDPSRILLLTFSANAAAELQRRIDGRFRRSYAESWVSTFHSFAYRIVRDYSPSGGRERRLMNGFQEKLLMRSVLRSLSPDAGRSVAIVSLLTSESFAQDSLWLISSLKQELVTATEFGTWVDAINADDHQSLDLAKLRVLAQVYRAYFAEQERLGLSDFRDVISEAVTLLETNAAVRQTLAEKFHFVIVDEYQDVDAAQVRLIDHLTRHHADFRHLAVVGDSNQSIYSFRGTSPAFLDQDWKFGGEIVRLDRNYRSVEPVVDVAQRVASRFGLGESVLICDRGASAWPAVQARHEVTAADEAAGIARMISELVCPLTEGGSGYRYDDIAIILRSIRRSGREIEDALQGAGIPHDMGVSPNFAASPVVRFAVCALNALGDPADDDKLFRLLESPLCGVPTADARRLMAEAARRRERERETLKGKSLSTVLNHVCFLMEAEDPTRWPLPWQRAMPSQVVRDEESARADPIVAIGPVTPPPSTESAQDVDRQARLADDIEEVSAEDKSDRNWTRRNAFYDLLSDTAKDAIHRFAGRWSILRSVADRIPVDALLYRVLQDLDIIGALMRDPEGEAWGDQLGSLRMLTRAVTDLVDFQRPLLGREPRLPDVIELLAPALREYVDELEPAGQEGSVHVLTIHGSKGLEFPVVFIPGMVAGRLPVTPRPRTPLFSPDEASWLTAETRKHRGPLTGPLPWVLEEEEFLKEEARLAYVAGTRARDLVVYSWADQYGDDDVAQPSAFLEPIGGAASGVATTERAELHRSPSFQTEIATVDTVEAAAFSNWLPWHGPILNPDPAMHMSSSGLTGFLACSRKLYYGKLLEIGSTGSPAAARGTAFHRAMQLFHAPETERRWRDQGADVMALYDQCCQTALDEHLALVDGLLEKRQEEQLLSLLFRNYALERDHWRDFRTLATEAQFRWPVDGGDVLGFIDRIVSSPDGRIEIVDYKTGTPKRLSEVESQLGMREEVPKDLQLLIYFFALSEGAEVLQDVSPQTLDQSIAAISLWFPKGTLKKPDRIRKVGLGDGASPFPKGFEYIDIRGRRTELRSMLANLLLDARAGVYIAEPKHDNYTCTAVWGVGCEFEWVCPGRLTEPLGSEFG